jgi:aspartate/methionine/tyrosine aminotransferase
VEPEAGLTALVHAGDGDAAAAALEKRGIGVARGSFFGAPEYVRIALGADPKAFAKGIRALRDYCGL